MLLPFSNLSQNIFTLRKALGDSVHERRYIATIPGRGYQFTETVRELGGESQEELFVESHSRSRVVIEELPGRVAARRVWGWLVLGVSVLLVGVGLYAARVRSKPAISPPPPNPETMSGTVSSPELVPVTSLPGEESMPAFSPEGGRVAFSWHSPDAKKSGIYAAVVGSQSLLRLTNNAGDAWPAWSRDGRFIAFGRYSGNKYSISLVPALGGRERLLYTGGHSPWAGPEGLSFSPNGKVLAFAEWNAETQQSSIKLLSLDGSGVRTLTSPPPAFNDSAPSFSPSGDRIAFVRSTGPIFVDEIFVVPATGGTPSQVTSDRRRMFSPPVWTNNGQELLFASTRAGMKSLWRIPAAGGTPVPIAGAGPGTDHPTIAPASGELAYEYTVADENFWRMELRGGVSAGSPARALLSLRTSNLMPQISPDGTRIAFESDRSGYEEIWICDSDGSNPTQVTHLERYSGSPRWSPDGRYLAFDFRSQQHTEIYVVEVASGSPHPVATFPEADDVVPSWSRDGRWIYFASNRGGKDFHVWKVPPNGGPPVQVTRNSGFMAYESRDGRSVFYSRLSQPGIWRVPAEGRAEKLVCQGPLPDDWANWTVADNGLYFVDSKAGSVPEVEFQNFETGKISAVGKLERPAFFGLTLAPDGKAIIYSQRDRNEHDIVMMKDFR